jgi:hypothetical protein
MRGFSRVGIGLSLCVSLAGGAIGCGPSPALEARRPEASTREVLPPNAAVVVVCDDDEDVEEAAAAPRKSVEYVRIDEWQSPPSAREMESRIEPRGNKPPDYVQLPSLKLHREIAPTTTYRVGRYWR